MMTVLILSSSPDGAQSDGEREQGQEGTELLDAAFLNIYGKPLASCSEPGMAMTGFTRDGKCANTDGDEGSHHICIDMANLTENFCLTTGQPNWCSGNSLCMGSAGQCPIQDWCVCQWAFAEYIAKSGCISGIKCEAVNMQAVIAYKEKASSDPQIAAALKCLTSRCKLHES